MTDDEKLAVFAGRVEVGGAGLAAPVARNVEADGGQRCPCPVRGHQSVDGEGSRRLDRDVGQAGEQRGAGDH